MNIYVYYIARVICVPRCCLLGVEWSLKGLELCHVFIYLSGVAGNFFVKWKCKLGSGKSGYVGPSEMGRRYVFKNQI